MSKSDSSYRQGMLTNPKMGKFEDYEVLKALGEGTFGVVSKAKRKRSDEPLVALKKVKQHENVGFPIETLREMKYQRDLQHDNIVRLLGICELPKNGSRENEFYLILELCDYDLRKVLNNSTNIKLDLKCIKCIMFKILNGLQFLHDNNMIHRDLKPENILLTEAGEVKLADFGLAKELDPSQKNQSNYNTNCYVTQWYRAPELLLGDKNYGKSIDIWSVGCIFAELWTREPIFQCATGNYTNQLQLIRALLGDIYWPGIDILESYKDLQLAPKEDPKFEKYINYRKVIKKQSVIEFIDKFLKLNPKERINVNDAMKSSFLKDYSPLALKSLVSVQARNTSTVGGMQNENSKQKSSKNWVFPQPDPCY